MGDRSFDQIEEEISRYVRKLAQTSLTSNHHRKKKERKGTKACCWWVHEAVAAVLNK